MGVDPVDAKNVRTEFDFEQGQSVYYEPINDEEMLTKPEKLHKLEACKTAESSGVILRGKETAMKWFIASDIHGPRNELSREYAPKLVIEMLNGLRRDSSVG